MADDKGQPILSDDRLHRLIGRMNALETILVWIMGELALRSGNPHDWVRNACHLMTTKIDKPYKSDAPKEHEKRSIAELEKALQEIASRLEDWLKTLRSEDNVQ